MAGNGNRHCLKPVEMSKFNTNLKATLFLLLTALVAGVLAVTLANFARADAALVLLNAGPFTEFMSPIVTALTALLGALVLGGSVLSGWIISPTKTIDAQNLDLWPNKARHRTQLLVAITAGIWTLLCFLRFLLSYSLAAGQSFFDPRFGSDLSVYARSELGAWLLFATIMAALTCAIAIMGYSARISRITAIAASLTLLSFAMTGHASTGTSHEMVTSAMIFHLIGLGIWLGPIIWMQFLPSPTQVQATAPGDDWVLVLKRFSSLALLAYIAMWLSGIAALATRITAPSQLLTHPYAQIGVLKAILLLLIAAFGYLQRQKLSAYSTSSLKQGKEVNSREVFRNLLGIEALVIVAALGLGAAMSSSAPPSENLTPPASPAGILTGYDLPPNPFTWEVLFAWRIDLLAVGLALVALSYLQYLHSSSRLKGSEFAISACLVISYAIILSSPIAVYARVLFSAHLTLTALMIVLGTILGLVFSSRAFSSRAKIPSKEKTSSKIFINAIGFLTPALILLGYLNPVITRLILEQYLLHQLFLLTILLSTMFGVIKALKQSLVTLILLLFSLALFFTQAVIAPSWFAATGRNWLADAVFDQQLGAVSFALLIIFAQLVNIVWKKLLLKNQSKLL